MRRLFSAFLALLLTALLATGWYMYQKGFTRRWRVFVSEEFRKRGVEVSLRKLVLVPFRGIVARDVKVYDSAHRRRTLAVVDDMLLVINYAELFKKRPFLAALDLRDARLAVPLDPKDPRGPALEINRLSGRLLLPPEQIYLSRLDAELYGIRISASGRLIHPSAYQPKARSVDASSTVALAERIIAELKQWRFEAAAPPQLNVRFSGDMAQMERVFVEASFEGRKIERGSYRIEGIQIEADCREGLVDLKQFTVTDTKGTLSANGRFELATKEASVRLRSTLDGFALATSLGMGPRDFQFVTAPSFELRVQAVLGEAVSLKATGHLQLQGFSFRTVGFDSLGTDFSWVNGDWSVRDLRLLHRGGVLTGDAMQVADRFKARLHSSINPQDFGPMLTGQPAQVFSQFKFKDAPVLDIEVQGPTPDPALCTLTGQIRLGRSSYRDSAAEQIQATLQYGQRKLLVEPFRLRRVEGESTGGVAVDFERNEVRLNRIRATVNPQEVIIWFEPNLLKDIAPYRFKRAPNLFLDGLIHVKHGDTTNLTVDVDAPSGMDYTFLKKNLSASQISGRLAFTDRRLKISGLNASLFSGKLKGEADISIVKANPGHTVALTVENMDFPSLTKLYFNYETSKGRMDGSYNFTGRGDDGRSMRGSGKVGIRDGNIFAIPFMGPVSGILDNIVPGMGHEVAKRLDATFAVNDGVITTNDLDVAGNGFSMFGGGKLMFLDDGMDFSIRINAHGLPGVLLFPVSKLFEYVSDEKLSKPRWHPKALRGLDGRQRD